MPARLAPTLVEKLVLYRLRSKVGIEDLSDQAGRDGGVGRNGCDRLRLALSRSAAARARLRCILPPDFAADAAAELGASLVDAAAYELHRIALAVPRGGLDFIYGDAFPHEADMDQLGGVDFAKGCYIGQEVVSRVEHRRIARTRIVPIAYDGFAPEAGIAVMAGDRNVGTLGSTAGGRGLAMLRLDRVADALSAGATLTAGGMALRVIKPDWATFPFPGEAKAAQ